MAKNLQKPQDAGYAELQSGYVTDYISGQPIPLPRRSPGRSVFTRSAL